jgi:hypothetical protein
MRLTLIGKDPASNPTGSPAVYRTDRASWIVQGWLVRDPEALAQLDIPDGEGCLEIPDSIVHFLVRVAVASITDEEFSRLLAVFEREAIHLENRDAYGTAVELPHMAKWVAGEHDDLEWLQAWCLALREHVRAGRSVRRARIVSEPLSEYQRWSYSIAHPMVEAGEDIRWVPRRLVSSIALPGNDFYLFDDRLVVFMVYAGNGLAADKVTSTDPADIRLCRSAFEAVWKLSIPHSDYQPF